MDGISPLVFLIPLISGFVGWFTNWVAVKAMLYPINFIGLPPIFGRNIIGWQGMIPKNTEALSKSFGKMINEQFVDIDELFKNIKHDDNEELDRLVERLTEQVIEEFSTNLAPEKWARAKDKLRQYIRNLVAKSIRQVSTNILEEMSKDAKDYIDIDKMVCDAMMADRALLGNVLVAIAGPEFDFIERSGLFFGFIFGIIQMTIWIIYPAQWLFPVAGFLVGYLTNYLALFLIFEPAEPIKIGPFTIQGLFIKRQLEVAIKFSHVLSETVLTAENMVKQLNRGSAREPVLAIIEGQVEKSLKKYEKDPMVAMLVSKEKLAEAKNDVTERVRNADMESSTGPMQAFAGHSSKIRSQIDENVRAMDASEFCQVLRPVFKKDEWQLILVGGILGFIAGVLQMVYLFGG